MIVIHTPTTGTHEFPGEHEVTNNGGTLKLAHHDPGCSWGLNPPVSSSDLAM